MNRLSYRVDGNWLFSLSEIVEKVRDASVERLTRMLDHMLARAESGEADQISGLTPLMNNSSEILETFRQGVFNHFQHLLDRDYKKPEPVYTFETLSLVQDDDLETMVALEGMVNSARNTQLPTFISFNTRLGSLFPDKQIDEATNPLDPSQIADAFKEAIQPLGLEPSIQLNVYRQFNTDMLRHLDDVLKEANLLLIDNGVMSDLGVDAARGRNPTARTQARQPDVDDSAGFGTVEETHYRHQENNPELFSMMQSLLHPDQQEPADENATPAQPASSESDQQYAIPASMAHDVGLMQPFEPAEGQQVQMVDQAQLMEILTNIQKALEAGSTQGDDDEAHRVDITSQLGEMLAEGQSDGVVTAVDRQSSDIINLVTMLYEAIWQDDSVPIPIKELIGRTQVTIIKVALSDTDFFNNEAHPARTVLNEFADAGIGWTEVEDLEHDSLYKKIEALVNKILTEFDGSEGFFDDIIRDFRTFRAREAAKTRVLEQRIMRASERQERLDDIHELVTRKIEERVLGRELPEFVKQMLEGPFHKFMVMLVLKEGPGTNAWKQAINTIDVLLWTVQPHEHASDRDRLETVNPRLLNNLRKALRIAQLDPEDIDKQIEGLKETQQASFADVKQPETPAATLEAPTTDPDELDLDRDQAAAREAAADHDDEIAPSDTEPASDDVDEIEQPLAEDDPLLHQVDQLSVGIWVEFAGEDEGTATRCKLAARINAIDKFIFVNRQGVKVVEKTRMGLARELKDGTVRFISDGPLFSRALESVIGNLRESQQQQQTGGAYRPDQ